MLLRMAPIHLNLFSHCAQKSVYRQFTRKEKGIGRRSFRDRKWVSTKEGRKGGRKAVTKKAKVDERKRERGNRIVDDINLFIHCQRNQESNQNILHNSRQASVKLADKGVMTVQKGPTVHLQPPHSNCASMWQNLARSAPQRPIYHEQR